LEEEAVEASEEDEVAEGRHADYDPDKTTKVGTAEQEGESEPKVRTAERTNSRTLAPGVVKLNTHNSCK
jgi:hypothetical protein